MAPSPNGLDVCVKEYRHFGRGATDLLGNTRAEKYLSKFYLFLGDLPLFSMLKLLCHHSIDPLLFMHITENFVKIQFKIVDERRVRCVTSL